MAKPLVPDDLWATVEPLLPPQRPKPKGGRPRVPDRAALTGILFVLTTGTPREHLPVAMGCGSGMTCWGRLRHWRQAVVWAQLLQVLLERLQASGRLSWDRAALDSTSVPAKGGLPRPARRRPIAEGTEVTLAHDRFADTGTATRHRRGRTESLERLEAMFGRAAG